ncbi:hypothetical protein [Legionella sainthelensi]|uniref:Secreted protein n=1 Tax=Legionella sainthelensi TaxID=28087 RepID=A0A2H5FPK1_9GAMM|nr:hypothetical protein [Legionella sainthelensi]AUH73485.1 hypothetical protein CAB17_16555 [Legionella sainthelensi]
MKMHISSLIFLFLFSNTSTFAYEYGGYHSGGGYYHGNYEHNGYYNGYHNNVWYGGTVDVNSWDDGIWYDNNLNDDTNGVVGVPDEGYYDPSCQTIDDCSTGTCMLVNTCE